jgi:Phage integrase, N-terminal SAM-like domain
MSQVYPRYIAQRSPERKSWRQGDKLMRKHVLPKFGKRKPKDITRADIWGLFDSLHDTPRGRQRRDGCCVRYVHVDGQT